MRGAKNENIIVMAGETETAADATASPEATSAAESTEGVSE